MKQSIIEYKQNYYKYKKKYLNNYKKKNNKGGSSFYFDDQELKQAIENSLNTEENVNKNISRMNYDDWINHQISDKAGTNAKKFKDNLNEIFKYKGWDVIDPRGDGYCTLYSALTDSHNSFRTDQQVTCNKEEINKNLEESIQNYFENRKRLKKLNYQNDDLNSIVIPIDEMDILCIDEDNYNKEEKKKEIKLKLEELLNKQNTPDALLPFIAHMIQKNILYLSYDSQSVKPFITQYIRTYSGINYIKDEYLFEGEDRFLDSSKGIFLDSSEDAIIILLNHSGHTYLFDNPEVNAKKLAKNTILNRENGQEEKKSI